MRQAGEPFHVKTHVNLLCLTEDGRSHEVPSRTLRVRCTIPPGRRMAAPLRWWRASCQRRRSSSTAGAPALDPLLFPCLAMPKAAACSPGRGGMKVVRGRKAGLDACFLQSPSSWPPGLRPSDPFTALFDQCALADDRCKQVADLGQGAHNTVRFNPWGRFLALAGFGNLPGDLVLHERRADGKWKQLAATR